MGDKTKIEWAEATWNPIAGCTAVSEGCQNCYAAALAARFSGQGLPYDGLAKQRKGRVPRWTGKIKFNEALLDKPRHWQRPRRIFVGSMTDLFHPSVTDDMRDQVFRVMLDVRRHEYMILTKRPEAMRAYLEASDQWTNVEPIEVAHIWFGVTAENQRRADERLPHLLNAPVIRRFVSAEPLLGPIDNLILKGFCCSKCHHPMPPNPGHFCPQCLNDTYRINTMVDLVIVGGESGPKSRPMHPAWVASIGEQCEAAGSAFFFKQWGEWAPLRDHPDLMDSKTATKVYVTLAGRRLSLKRTPENRCIAMVRVGKRKSGAALNGKTYQEFPKPLLSTRMFERDEQETPIG